MTLRTDAVVQPTQNMKDQVIYLDWASKKEFSKPYDNLDDLQKTQIHMNIKMGVYKEKRESTRPNQKAAGSQGSPTSTSGTSRTGTATA
jgi:hypothetical protein